MKAFEFIYTIGQRVYVNGVNGVVVEVNVRVVESKKFKTYMVKLATGETVEAYGSDIAGRY
jgi:hypothetical protein